MKIHYISCHSILEYDEVQMFLDLGHEVFSNGAYTDPNGHITLPRPGLKGGTFYPEWAEAARNHPKTALPPELIEPFDVLIFMHNPDAVINNWPNIKHKRVIFRSIGQNTPSTERKLKKCREEGLQIVRYSPKEKNLAGYIGDDATIRFYKDPNIYHGWSCEGKDVINFTQSLKGRHDFVHAHEILPVIKHFAGRVYGTGNDDLGELNGGEVSWTKQLEIMQRSRVAVYGGTWPAPYTLSIMEYMLVGIPTVVISKKLAHMVQFESIDFYEVEEIFNENGLDFLVADSVSEMIEIIDELRSNMDLCIELSMKLRSTAIKYFGKAIIYNQWKEFLQ